MILTQKNLFVFVLMRYLLPERSPVASGATQRSVMLPQKSISEAQTI